MRTGTIEFIALMGASCEADSNTPQQLAKPSVFSLRRNAWKCRALLICSTRWCGPPPPRPCVTFPASVMECSLQTSPSSERLCGSVLAPAWEGRQGTEAAPVRRGAGPFSHRLRADNVDDFPLRTQTSASGSPNRAPPQLLWRPLPPRLLCPQCRGHNLLD